MVVLPDRGERQTAGIERNPFGRGLDETVADAVSSSPCSRRVAVYRRHRRVFRPPTTSEVQGCGYGGKRGRKPRENKGEEVASWPD